MKRSFKRLWKKVKSQHERVRSRLTCSLHVPVQGGKLTFATSHPLAKQWFFPRYLNGRQHEPKASSVLISNLRPNDTVLDVGAHLGYFTVLAGFLAPEGEVHAIEIDPRLAPLIQNSVSQNRGNAKTYITVTAVSNQSGAVFGFQPEKALNLSTNRITEIVDASDSSFLLPSVTIDDYCRSLGITPDFIKMDIEGGEASALKGMHNILRSRPRILLEFHPAAIRDQGVTPEALLRQLCDALPTHSVFLLPNYRHSEVGLLEPISSQFCFNDETTMLYFAPVRSQ